MNIFKRIIKKYDKSIFVFARYSEMHKDVISVLLKERTGTLYDIKNNTYVFVRSVKFSQPLTKYVDIEYDAITPHQALEIAEDYYESFLDDLKEFEETNSTQETIEL